MEENDKKYNMEVLNNFIGYGNPDADYWFMGIEEGGCWELEDFVDDGSFNKYQREYIENGKNSYYFTKERCCELTLPEGNSHLAGKVRIAIGLNYWKDITSIKANSAFICNLYPIANKRAKQKYPEYYSKYFGVKGREDINDLFLQQRKIILKSFFNKYLIDKHENHIKYLICHGPDYWEEYKKFLNSCFKSELIFKDIKNDCKCAKLSNVNVILSPHLSGNKMSGTKIKEVLNYCENPS